MQPLLVGLIVIACLLFTSLYTLGVTAAFLGTKQEGSHGWQRTAQVVFGPVTLTKWLLEEWHRRAHSRKQTR